MAKKFNGVVNIDVRDSVAGLDTVPGGAGPRGRANVLLVLYDDTGLAAWSPYGGRINMPTMQKLADNGLTYTQWHTTALCSPTRSCLLTGRNHHQNGFAQIAEGAQGFPGHTGHIPMENATIGEVLRENGYNTYWVGKNHNVPLDEWAVGATRRNWPLARGFDRYYGFIGGETNNWYPTLVEDNHYVDQPYLPEEGYHLSKDLADKAISLHRRQQDVGAEEAVVPVVLPGRQPRPAPRAAGVHRQVRRPVRRRLRGLPRVGAAADGRARDPAGGHRRSPTSTRCRARPPCRWTTSSRGTRSATRRSGSSPASPRSTPASRSTPTPRSAGSSTTSRRPASSTTPSSCTPPTTARRARAARTARVNENKFFNAYPEDLEQNLSMLDELGSPDTYNHYPTGWATAFSTPFKMFKRYTYQGGVADPLVISWPKGIAARGEVRNQYHHAVDIVPTILECVGLELPDQVLGYAQTELPGVSMKYTFDADGPTQKVVQYYEMMGTRALWHQGWHVVAQRAPQQGGTAADLAQRHLGALPLRGGPLRGCTTWPPSTPTRSRSWSTSGTSRPASTTCCRSTTARSRTWSGTMPVADIPEGGIYRYYPEHAHRCRSSRAAEIRGRSFKILAQVELDDADAQGVLIANGARFGGHTLVPQGPEALVRQQLPRHPAGAAAGLARRRSPRATCSAMEFAKESHGDHGEAVGTATLYVDDLAVAKSEWKTQPVHFALCGEGLTVGRDSSDPVSKEYGPPFAFTGGRIRWSRSTRRRRLPRPRA